jgi:hypothetical protein
VKSNSLRSWVWVLYTTDGQSASLSWNKAPIWGLRPYFYYCQTFACLLIWGALSDERKGLWFTTAPGPRQRSYFQVRVPWDSWPYFTVSDSGLPFRHLLRLAGLPWRYSTPPPYGSPMFLSLHTNCMIRNGPHIKHRVQQFLYCSSCIRCCGNEFTEPLPSKWARVDTQTPRWS